MNDKVSVNCRIYTHTWKKNTLLSIAAGTALYMVLVQVVFV